MIRIGIDCRFGGARGGLGSFTRGLARMLVRKDASRTYVLFVHSTPTRDASRDEEWLKELREFPTVELVQAPYPHYSLSEQIFFPPLIRKAAIDLLIVPHFNVPLSCPVPFVCTVHDLILHRYPNEASIPKRLSYRLLLKLTLRRAGAVIAISEATKDDLLKRYPFASDKTTVIYPGIDPIFSPRPPVEQERVRKKYGLDKPYFLYIGNCKQHKNIPMLLEAFWRAALQEYDLVLIAGGKECEALARNESAIHGKWPFGPEGPLLEPEPRSRGQALKGKMEKRIRILSSVPNEDLPALYSASAGCVTATLAEGFCLPLIEAMACGCPVLATNVGPIPEVCNEHAWLTEPSVEAIAKGFERLATDSGVRDPNRLRWAMEWSKRYSWEPMFAERIVTLIDDVLKN